MDLIKSLDLHEESPLISMHDLKDHEFEKLSNTEITLEKKKGFKNKTLRINPLKIL